MQERRALLFARGRELGRRAAVQGAARSQPGDDRANDTVDFTAPRSCVVLGGGSLDTLALAS